MALLQDLPHLDKLVGFWADSNSDLTGYQAVALLTTESYRPNCLVLANASGSQRARPYPAFLNESSNSL